MQHLTYEHSEYTFAFYFIICIKPLFIKHFLISIIF